MNARVDPSWILVQNPIPVTAEGKLCNDWEKESGRENPSPSVRIGTTGDHHQKVMRKGADGGDSCSSHSSLMTMISIPLHGYNYPRHHLDLLSGILLLSLIVSDIIINDHKATQGNMSTTIRRRWQQKESLFFSSWERRRKESFHDSRKEAVHHDISCIIISSHVWWILMKTSGQRGRFTSHPPDEIVYVTKTIVATFVCLHSSFLQWASIVSTSLFFPISLFQKRCWSELSLEPEERNLTMMIGEMHELTQLEFKSLSG